jgi:hypothetical protein
MNNPYNINSRYKLSEAGDFLDTAFFSVCSGDRPIKCFLQKEAWEAYLIAKNSTSRAVERTVIETS